MNQAMILPEAPSCFYNPVKYNNSVSAGSVHSDTVRLVPECSARDTQVSNLLSPPVDLPSSVPAGHPTFSPKSVTAKSQRGLFMFPTGKARFGTQQTPTIGEVDLIGMQINGKDQEKEVVDGTSVLYKDVTLGIFIRMPDEASASKGTYQLELARHMDATLTKTNGVLRLDAKTRGRGPRENLDNMPVWHGQKVFKHTGEGNSLVWKNRYMEWEGVDDVTDEKAEDLWRQWSPPCPLGVSAGQAACGETVNYDTTGSIQSDGGAVTAHSSLADLVGR